MRGERADGHTGSRARRVGGWPPSGQRRHRIGQPAQSEPEAISIRQRSRSAPSARPTSTLSKASIRQLQHRRVKHTDLGSDHAPGEGGLRTANHVDDLVHRSVCQNRHSVN
jgi:hypothetical protein